MDQENGDHGETPTKRLKKTPQKRITTPRKPKVFLKKPQGEKALEYFHDPIPRVENGSHKIYYECSLCNRDINGTIKTNLCSHLKTTHWKVYAEIVGIIEEPVEIKRLRLLQNCVSIIALGGRPFAALRDFGFQQIIENHLKELEIAGCPIDLKNPGQYDVHKQLHEAAELVRDEISAAIKNRPISVQLDIGTRLGRSVFGIDVQYIPNSSVVIHNIGMIVMEKSRTGEYLLDRYRSCLKRYNIERKQIVSITGDNGKNVQKMIRLEATDHTTEELSAKKKVSRRLNYERDESVAKLYEVQEADGNIDDAIEEILQTDEVTDENAIDLIFNQCNISFDDIPSSYDPQNDELLQTLVSQLASEHDNCIRFDLSGIKCAVHTVQLSVKDALKELPTETKNIIALSCRIAKVLRLDSTKYLLEGSALEFKRPRLDVETRWGSTYLMVSLFQENKMEKMCIDTLKCP